MVVLEQWEYDNHPNHSTVGDECARLIASLSAVSGAIGLFLQDTRTAHQQMFAQVVPPGMEYLAGNYRGAPFPQLEHRMVGIGAFLGAPPNQVDPAMAEFHARIEPNLQRLKQVSVHLTPKNKIIAFCRLIGAFFVRFLAIHPYANGNGHISRLIVWCFFTMFSVSSTFWQVPNRNISPPDQLIGAYRMGNPDPLIDAFVQLVEGENSDVAL